MAKIVLATFGSLGDLHPKIALALELRSRGHAVKICAMEFYREKIEALGIDFSPMRPDVDPDDKALAKLLMDPQKGPEQVIAKTVMPNLMPMFNDLMSATQGYEVLITGEIVYAARAVVELTGINWVSTSLSPISFFSAYDPSVPPTAPWLANLNFLGKGFYRLMFSIAKRSIDHWYEPFREFRSSVGLDPNIDPIFTDKYSDLLHLCLFSKVLGRPQPDWPPRTLQTGFCFYDGKDDLYGMPADLENFVNAGEPPIVFTLGSAAVMDPRDFFTESIAAAKLLGRRAVVLYGIFNEKPTGLTDDIAGFEYAPFSLLFPRASCVVHQGGVGTTGYALRSGVPHLIMPYSHDQPDNAARCVRAGVAQSIDRSAYNAKTAAKKLEVLLSDEKYRQAATAAAKTVISENGTSTACDAIEAIVNREIVAWDA